MAGGAARRSPVPRCSPLVGQEITDGSILFPVAGHSVMQLDVRRRQLLGVNLAARGSHMPPPSAAERALGFVSLGLM